MEQSVLFKDNSAADRYLLRNCRIYDGSGQGCYPGEILIREGRIAAIGRDIKAEACEVIDMKDMAVAPGFIDIHRHADLQPFHWPDSGCELMQGITTMISGNCGFSPFPLLEERMNACKEFVEPLLGRLPEKAVEWTDFDSFLQAIRKKELNVNQGTLVGNGILRVAVNGTGDGPVPDRKMRQIEERLKEALQHGAFGLSMGLMYAPECYYSEEELGRICKVAAAYGAVITVHLRGEGSMADASVREVLRLCRSTGAHFHISHLKAAGRDNWGPPFEKILDLLYEARLEGLPVTWDAYPYEAGSTTLTTLLPPWALAGGTEKILERLRDTRCRQRILADLGKRQSSWDNLVYATGWDRVTLLSGTKAAQIGKNIGELARENGVPPEEMCLDILLEDACETGIAFFHMDERDVRKVIGLKETAVISDSIYSQQGFTHPRSTGTYPKFIQEYVNVRKDFTMEETIRKCTSLPAEYMGIRDRGRICAGYYADIIAFRPEEFVSRSTYEKPGELPAGMKYVFVNGRPAVRQGNIVRLDAGRYLTKERESNDNR
ncbi:N-acyl-D-amino-acid deacylase family protein [Diplocloster agilis]|uniref:N-acyl-D-amino-acid deacylase family protein n=1 Tax=Diplocloster agilis TaxID=2850323 RepID=UPI0008208566|nr:amidohydrolase family protein [Suonthocola fibrivorans]MCU6736611.1 amidohydrolase family protein [Suonthocola fibrivorans]SCJ92206.1 D-aminoacylase [uncultured Clostridium sp.]